MNRLTEWDLVGIFTQGFQYDPIGNLTQRTDGGTVNTYGYTDPNHPHAVRQHQGVNQFSYDNNGNMVGRYSNSMTYDVENRLTRNSHSSGITDSVYNGDSVRVKKVVTVGAAVTTTVYIGNLYESSSWTGGSTWSKYYYFGGKRVAMRTPSGVTYLHSDHLGSTSATSGATVSSQKYYPYGSFYTPNPSTLPTDLGFTGQRYDASDGLMDYGARYYAPGLGRFVQPDTIVPDPLDPQSLNRYSYVQNNPVRYTDPTGHMMDDGLDGGGAGDGSYSRGHTDDRPYCEKYPYSYGCYTPPLPATNDGAPRANS